MTNVTGIRSLIGVRSFVYQQVVRLGETPLTESTDELLFGTRRDPVHSSQFAREVVVQVWMVLERTENGLRTEVGCGCRQERTSIGRLAVG